MEPSADSNKTTPTKAPAWNLAISSEHRLRAENLAFDIDVWYPALKQFTFPTLFHPLTRTEATAIFNHYRTKNGLKRDADLSLQDIQALDSLEKQLDVLIKTNFGDTGAFLRLCGRSPKDADPLDYESVYRRYTELLAEYEKEGEDPDDPSTKVKAIAHVSTLQVKSGEEAMSLILTSERVYADILDWVLYGEPEQIVLRQWEPNLSLDYEFRAFVCKNKVTAISQYDHYGVYPYIFPLKERIQHLILEKWAEVHEHVGIPNYCMDFGYLPNSDSIVVIELSPFMDCTGTACFKWSTDRDLLENGPLTFRMNQKMRPDMAQVLEVNWDMEWTKNVKPYKVYLEKVKNKLSKDSSMLSDAGSWFMSKLNTVYKREPNVLFVYGTLKRGFHWNMKFLQKSTFVSKATTNVAFPLVFGESGVPYLLGDQEGKGHMISGELWRISDETLLGLDEYEGVSKGYYERIEIKVKREGSTRDVVAFVYCLKKSTTELLEKPFQKAYDLAFHQKNYDAIRHILVKQEKYLGLADGKD